MQPRLSMLGAMGLVASLALALTAIREANAFWASVTGFLTLAWLAASLVCVLLRRGPARGFWVGFAVFGWTYFWVVDGSDTGHNLASTVNRALGHVVEQAMPNPPPLPGLNAAAQARMLTRWAMYRRAVRAVVGDLISLAFALAGGLFGRCVWMIDAAARAEEPPFLARFQWGAMDRSGPVPAGSDLPIPLAGRSTVPASSDPRLIE